MRTCLTLESCLGSEQSILPLFLEQGWVTKCLYSHGDPTHVFVCSDYIEHSVPFHPPPAATKRVGGFLSFLPKSLPKSTKPHTHSGSDTHANIFMRLFAGFDFQIKFREQSFNTAAFKKQMRRSVHMTKVYLTENLLQYSPNVFFPYWSNSKVWTSSLFSVMLLWCVDFIPVIPWKEWK